VVAVSLAAIFLEESKKHTTKNGGGGNIPHRHIPAAAIVGSGYLEYEKSSAAAAVRELRSTNPNPKQPPSAASTLHPLIQLINRAFPFTDTASYYHTDQSIVMHIYNRRGKGSIEKTSKE
jgi:hypothetical protein